MKKYLKKIDVFSAAKVTGILSGGVYFILVLIVVSLGALVVDQTSIDKLNFLGFSSTLVASFIFAIIIGVVNFIITVLLVWLYNLTSSFFGGIKVELEDIDDDLKFKTEGLPRLGSGQGRPKTKKIDESDSIIGNPKPQKEINEIIGNTDNEERETFKT